MPVFYQLMERLFPLPPGYGESGPSAEELKPRFKRWYNIDAAISFAAAGLVGVILWRFFLTVGKMIERQFLGALATFTMDPALWWWAAAVPLAGAAGAAISAWGLRRKLGEDYALYERYNNLTAHWYNTAEKGFHITRAARMGSVLLVVLGVVMSVLFLDWYVVFTRDKIVLNPFFSVGATTRSYRDISQIVTATRFKAGNGKVVEGERHYVMRFKNGDIFSTGAVPESMDEQKRAAIAQYASRQSGIPIREIPMFKDGEI